MKRSLRKYSLTLRHIGHTRTNNGLFKLVEALLIAIDSLVDLFTKYVHGLPLSACHCLAALPAKMRTFNSLM